jgi:hypothetical protein
MIIILWIISLVFMIIGIYISIMNWAVFFNNYLFRKKWTSAIPLIGGLSAALGLICLPINGSWKYFWVPLLIDWGSIPVIIASLCCHYKSIKKNE